MGGLVRDRVLPKLCRNRSNLVARGDDLHTAGLATAAGMDLRLDDIDRAAQLSRGGNGIDREGGEHAAAPKPARALA